MAKRNAAQKLLAQERDDRTRILTTIINGLASTMLLDYRRVREPDPQRVDFEHLSLREDELKPGDLVLCHTNPHHWWGVSEFVERHENEGWPYYVLRDLETGQLLNMHNESLIRITGLRAEDRMIGPQRKVYLKVLKAFSRFRRELPWEIGDIHRYYGLKWLDDNINRKPRSKSECEVTVGPRGIASGGKEPGTKKAPYTLRITVTASMSVAEIGRRLQAAGYGREWEIVPDPDDYRLKRSAHVTSVVAL